MKAKSYLSREISSEELYQIVEDGMGLPEVKQVKKNLNTIEIHSDLTIYKLSLNGKELTIVGKKQKDKMPLLIGIMIVLVSFGIILPFLMVEVFYAAFLAPIAFGFIEYAEASLGKKITDKIADKVYNS